jgi:hypothetical protein
MACSNGKVACLLKIYLLARVLGLLSAEQDDGVGDRNHLRGCLSDFRSGGELFPANSSDALPSAGAASLLPLAS